jgi:hypothetical protein
VAEELRGEGQVLVSVAEEGHVPRACDAVWEVRNGSVDVRKGAEDAV